MSILRQASVSQLFALFWLPRGAVMRRVGSNRLSMKKAPWISLRGSFLSCHHVTKARRHLGRASVRVKIRVALGDFGKLQLGSCRTLQDVKQMFEYLERDAARRRRAHPGSD